MNLYEFLCKNCGYQVNSPGGKSGTMLSEIESMLCADCKIISNVVTGFCNQEWRPPDEKSKAELGHCTECKGTHLVSWTKPYPCPKCGNRMSKKDRGLIAC